MMKKHNRYVILFMRIISIIIGALLAAIGLELFLILNNIIDGGIVGISIIVSHLSKLPLGIFIFVFNIPFLVTGYKQIGKTFALSTLFAVILLSLFVTLLHPLDCLTRDVLLAAVFGGIVLGVGVGMIIRNGGSLDGTEIIAIILDRKTGFSIGEIIMFFNVFILGSSGFVFGWDRAMYSLMAYFIAFKVIDVTVEGLDESKAIFIVSEKYKDIADAIRDRLGRGFTLLEGKGGYKNTATHVIYVVVTRLEIAKLKSIVNGFDEDAFVTIGSVDVIGKRYKKKAIH